MTKFKIILFIICLCTLFSCDRDGKAKQAKWEQKVAKTLNDHLDKTFYYPSDTVLYGEKIRPLKDVDHRIYVYIDGTCSQCVKEMDFWEKFTADLDSRKTTNYSLNLFVFTLDPIDFQNEIENLDFKLTWQTDTARIIPSKNGLWDKRFQVVLLDRDDKIKIIGNPILNPELRKYYIDYIINN